MPSEQSTVLRTTGALDLVADIWREATGAVMGESRGILTLQTSDEARNSGFATVREQEDLLAELCAGVCRLAINPTPAHPTV